MHNKWGRLLLTGAAMYLIGRRIFPSLLPFLLAMGGAVLLEPAVLWCTRRLGFQRKFAAAAMTALLLGFVFLVMTLLVGRMAEEGKKAMEQLPDLLSALPDAMKAMERRYEGFYRTCPAQLRLWLDNTVQIVSEKGVSAVGELSAGLLGKIPSLMGKVPQLLLFLFTTLLAAFFTAVSYPEIVGFLKRQIPERWRQRGSGAAECLRSTFWKWLKAEGILCLATFCLLLLGFWYLRLEYAFLLAAIIAVLDALPVLGAGLFLVPWALGHLLLGSVPRGVSLLALYAVILLVRSILEPKLMAEQVGLPPLSALFAMYVGYSLFGVGGMVLCPVLLLFLKQLQDGGYVRVWR